MIFQDITTDQQWSEAVRLRNLYNWSHPVTVAETVSFYERANEDRKEARFVGLLDNQIVCFGTISENLNAGKDVYWFGVYLDPRRGPDAESILKDAIEECIRRIQAFGGTRCLVEARGEYPMDRNVLNALEFQHDKTLPYSCATVAEHDYPTDNSVMTFGEFMRQYPDDGLHRIWRLEMDVASDLPLPFPFTETPYEHYAKFLADPEIDLESKFLLFEEGELKGLSQLWPSKVNPTLAATGLTGVRRQFRRQRVATRLKQHAINWAAKQGIERIFTDNEENNPMYQLNLQLGFRHLFDYEVYSKTC